MHESRSRTRRAFRVAPPVVCVLSLLIVLACSKQPPLTAPSPAADRPWRVAHAARVASDALFDEEPLATDLGLAPGDAPDSTIEALLAHRFTLPAQVTVGILHLPGARALRAWFYGGEAAEITQPLADSAVMVMSRTPRVGRAAVLPALLVGDRPTVSRLREAAARLQADILMLYRPSCRLYERVPFVGSTQYRAVCTIEAVLLDTRSGVLPFSTVITREDITQRQRGDFDQGGTWRRVQLQALIKAVVEVSQRVGAFLTSVPEPQDR